MALPDKCFVRTARALNPTPKLLPKLSQSKKGWAGSGADALVGGRAKNRTGCHYGFEFFDRISEKVGDEEKVST